jgi:hypothetical protein
MFFLSKSVNKKLIVLDNEKYKNTTLRLDLYFFYIIFIIEKYASSIKKNVLKQS